MGSLPAVMCCGLSCMDVELQSCEVPPSRESVVEFRGTSSIPGGSAPQTSRSLAALGVDVAVVTAVGDDARGRELRALTELGGRVQVFTVVTSRATGVAFLPLFKDGTRACFVDLGANLVADAGLMMPPERLATLSDLKVFHFGYPHLMPLLQGTALRTLFDRVQSAAPQALITLDMNGAKASEDDEPVLTAALPLVAAVHANLDEACIISGIFSAHRTNNLGITEIRPLVQWFTDRGAGIALITCGRNGVFAGTGRDISCALRLSPEMEQGAFIYRPCIRDSQRETSECERGGRCVYSWSDCRAGKVKGRNWIAAHCRCRACIRAVSD